MFKNLREKIGTSDPNKSKKKSSVNNEDFTGNENSNDFSKNSGTQNLSRFSSISSLVSDVGSAFSKTMTAPQHIQPSNASLKVLYDNESISEYDDSISGGDICTKEELFQRYQRAQAFARRYKTRYLEIVENYKKIESDNIKLTQTLTDSQDKQIRRVNELKEQIELDKQAKKDVEDNYILMIEEKTELVNVLKLQVNLLKEGKDLPPELEEQIKMKHEIEVLLERKKGDEIKDLKTTLSQRENLLQRCKDKINSLNSQLHELKLKSSMVQDTSISNDDAANQIFNEFSQQRAQRVIDLERVEQEHNERVQNLLKEFESKRLDFETGMKIKFEEQCTKMKYEEQQMKEKIKNLTLENESLLEQFNIKTKIIQNLMNDQFTESQDYCDPSILNTPLEKLKLCKLIINKYSSNVHPVVDELSGVLTSIKIMPTVEISSSYVGKSEEFTEEVSVSNTNEMAKLNDLEEKNKLFCSKIEQMEKLKLICDEENINREKELVDANLILEEEKKNYYTLYKRNEEEIENLQIHINQLSVKNEEILRKLSETQSILTKTEDEKNSIIEEKELLLKSSESLELSISNLEVEKNNLFQELQKTCNEYSDMESKFGVTCTEYETNRNTLTAKQGECKNLTDKLDELMTSLNHLNSEKNELIMRLNEKQVDVSINEEQLSLNIVEIQQRFDQETEELKQRLIQYEEFNEEKSIQISQMNIQIVELKELIELSKQDFENVKTLNSRLSEDNENKDNLVKSNENLLQNANNENESLKFQLEEMICKIDIIMKEKEELLNEIGHQKVNISNMQEEIDNTKNFNKSLSEETNNLLKEKEEMIIELKEKSNSLEKAIEEKSLTSDNLESVKLELNEVLVKQNSLILENECINENVQKSSKENELMKIRLQEFNLNIDKITKEKEELLNNIELENSNIKNIQEEIGILKITNQQLLDKSSNLQKEKDDLIIELNEKSDLLGKEIQERLIVNDNLINSTNSLEVVQSKLSELMNKQDLLIKEYESTTENLQKSLVEIEMLKSQLSDREEIASKYTILREENMVLFQQFETYKKEVSCFQENVITDKDILNNLKKEISNLTSTKYILENQVTELNEKCSLFDAERVSLIDSLNLQKATVEEIDKEKTKIIAQLEVELKNYIEIIMKNEESISALQKIIDEKNETIAEGLQNKNDLSSKINLIESYLCKFCAWIEELMIIEDCHGECSQPTHNILSSPIHWNSEMETECFNSKILIFTGQAIEKLLSINHRFHSEFHEIRKHSIESGKLQVEYQKKLDTIKKEVGEILKIHNKTNSDTDDNVHLQLKTINSTIADLNNQLTEKTNILLEIESQCSLLIDTLSIDNLSFIDNISISFYLFGLERKINDVVHHFKQELLIKEETHKKTRMECEKTMEEKLEKSNILLVQMFKQLINIFHFSDINVNNFVDINKQTRKIVIKKLKEFVKNHDQLINELHDVNTKLLVTEKDLSTTIELNRNIQTELDDLKNSVANDRDRLIATGEELENSMRRLNEVADEKGRIDEEKQSLRKELKELNEKISNLKLEFEKQSSEKQRLEMQFDESLEKVKLNHTALEEMYKNELEKQHGYQRNLEQQIASHRESTTLKLSESEKKLEEVLNQSEQLLELNHQYKKLLDEAKIESDEVVNKYLIIEKQNCELQIQFDRLNSDKIELNEIINNLQTTQNEISLERDMLKNDIAALQNENKTSVESMQKTTNYKIEEIEILKTELYHIRLTNETLKNKVGLLESSNEEMIQKEKSMFNESCEMTTQKVEFENHILHLQQKLEDTEIKCHTLNTEKNQLLIQLNDLQRTCDQMKIQIGELKNLVHTYKNQVEDFNLEIEQMKTRHNIDKEELQQLFSEEKSIMEDDVNRRVKKLAKEFNDKIFEKERDFQKTFEEALNTIRKDEGRIKSDLRATVDELNKSTIELQTERNQLLDQLTDNEKEIKTLKKLIEFKDLDIESAKTKIDEYTNIINALEIEKQSIIAEKISKMNQTVESSTCYEEPFLDNVGVKDHEVLLMHCSDIEEQLKQLQAENINLRKAAVVNNNDLFSSSITPEPIIYASKTKQLSNQPSISSDISKSSIHHHGGIYRSPNISCSDYTFCPIPITEATDYEYLRDVLLKYMTGMETEILAKVVCTVMKFSNEETSRVLLFEQDRNKFIRRIL